MGIVQQVYAASAWGVVAEEQYNRRNPESWGGCLRVVVGEASRGVAVAAEVVSSHVLVPNVFVNCCITSKDLEVRYWGANLRDQRSRRGAANWPVLFYQRSSKLIPSFLQATDQKIHKSLSPFLFLPVPL